MGVGYGPNIITRGLGFYVDFSNAKSVNTSTGALYDLSTNAIPIALTNNSANTLSLVNGYAEFTPLALTTTTSTYYTIANSYFDTIVNEMTLETDMYVINDFGSGQYCRGVSPRIIESGSPLGFSITASGITTETNTTAGWKTSTVSSTNSGYNKWVHVTQTVSTTSGLFLTYINGKLVGTTALLGATPNSGNGLLIGRGYYGGIANYAGRVGFVRVYNRALSETEISQNFNALRSRYNI